MIKVKELIQLLQKVKDKDKEMWFDSPGEFGMNDRFPVRNEIEELFDAVILKEDLEEKRDNDE